MPAAGYSSLLAHQRGEGGTRPRLNLAVSLAVLALFGPVGVFGAVNRNWRRRIGWHHTPPYGCTLVDGGADGPGLIEICGLALAEPASVPPETRPDAVTQILGARRMRAAAGADAAVEVRKRPANLMTWCERCATGIHFRCANDHAIGHGGDDCIGAYRAKDIAARSLLCLDCWATHRPYVDESDGDEVERGDQPERCPNRLRWRWPGRPKESLDAAA